MIVVYNPADHPDSDRCGCPIARHHNHPPAGP